MSKRLLTNVRLLRSVGGEIASRRRQCGLSQEDLAELSSLHPNTLGRIERGECDASIILLSYLYFKLDSTGVRIDQCGVVPMHHGGLPASSLPEVSFLRPPAMVRMLAEAVRARRHDLSLTMRDAASISGIHPNSLWNFESGLVCPSITTYFHLLRTLEVSTVSLSAGAPLLR